jgi:hypothetical protein
MYMNVYIYNIVICFDLYIYIYIYIYIQYIHTYAGSKIRGYGMIMGMFINT